jgi:hypothetical protein
MFVLNHLRTDGELHFRVPDRDVGIKSWRELSFAVFQSGKPRRPPRHPFAQLLDRQPALFHICPHDRQAQLQDAIPPQALKEVTGLAQLEIRVHGE